MIRIIVACQAEGIRLRNHLPNNFIPIRIVHQTTRIHRGNVSEAAMVSRFGLHVYEQQGGVFVRRADLERSLQGTFLFLPQILNPTGERNRALTERRSLAEWLTPPTDPGITYRTAPYAAGCYLALVSASDDSDPILLVKWGKAISMAIRVPQHAVDFGHSIFVYGVRVPLDAGDARIPYALTDLEGFIRDEFIRERMRRSILVGGVDRREVAEFVLSRADDVHTIYKRAAAFSRTWVRTHSYP